MSISSRPTHIRVEYRLNDGLMNLMRVLCTQRKVNEYLFEDRKEKSRLHIMKDADAHIMCFGHTHKPCHRIPEEQTENGVRYRHAITIGSVGKPKNGSPKGCYVMLTINEYSSTKRKNSVHAAFVRFNYDVEQANKAIKERPLPNGCAAMLRRGY